MLFPTFEFATFFAVVLPLSWLLMPHPRLWKPCLIAASYVFYGSADWHFVFLLAGSTFWNQTCALLLSVPHRSSRARRALLTAAIAGDLGVLGWFKYYGFFATNVASAAHRFGLAPPLPLLQVALPIGISFFTFQAMSYVIDVYRGGTPVPTVDFALYLCFFPHLIAGPIVRASELVPQFAAPRDPRKIEASRAFALIAGGLVKKVILADTIATQIVDPVFSSPGLHTRGDIIAAVYGYAVQIYCDFSAYSDMAMGLALLLGFRFPANFDRPYAALTLQDFWHRWHMSLSRWLRDYLYIGLGGNRKKKARTYLNLMVTMLLGGLWHGAAWNFVLWGGLHGGGLAAERWIDGERRGRRPALPLLRWLITFHLVCLAWVFFRADSVATVGVMLHQMIYAPGPAGASAAALCMIAAGLVTQLVPRRVTGLGNLAFARLGAFGQGLVLACVLVVTGAYVTGQGVAPFIYYRF